MTVVTCYESAAVGTRLEYDHDGRLVKQTPCPRQVSCLVEGCFLIEWYCYAPWSRSKVFLLQKNLNRGGRNWNIENLISGPILLINILKKGETEKYRTNRTEI